MKLRTSSSTQILALLILLNATCSIQQTQEAPNNGKLPDHLLPCISEEHLRKLWVNPEWDKQPTSYQENQLYKFRRYSRDELSRMVEAWPIAKVPITEEPALKQIVENMIALSSALLGLSRETPAQTEGQKIRLEAYHKIYQRYLTLFEGIERGLPVSLPRWYHGRDAEHFVEEIIRSTAIDEQAYFPGAFVGSIPESRYGDYYVIFGPEVARQRYTLAPCGTRIENTQLREEEWESFVYEGYEGGFALRRAVALGAIPDADDLDHIGKTAAKVDAVKNALERVVSRAPTIGAAWKELPLWTYHTVRLEHHLLALARTCSPQRASELWFGTFQLADLESRVIGNSEEEAAQALHQTVPGQLLVSSAPWQDSGLFVVIEDPSECSQNWRSRPASPLGLTREYCRVKIPTSANGVSKLTCMFPMIDRAPHLFQLESSWLIPDSSSDKLSLSGVTNLQIQPEDRKDFYQALANGRYEVLPRR